MTRKLAIIATLFTAALLLCTSNASAQDWFKTGTGLGVSKARLAVPEFAVRQSATPALEKTFHDVLWSDLEFCGVLDLVSPSFYPPANSQPAQRSHFRGMGSPTGECVHAGLRQSVR